MNSKLLKHNYTSGQALIIILLVMSVVLALVLSVVSRSVTDVAITSYEEDSARAFSAAEAGIEEYLNSGIIGSSSLDSGTSYTTQLDTSSSDPDNEFVYRDKLFSGETATFWLVSHDTSNRLTCTAPYRCFRGTQMELCWGEPGTAANMGSTPALELQTFYDESLASIAASPNYAGVNIESFAYDPNTTRSGDPNNFQPANTGCTVDGQSFAFSTGTISLPSEFPATCPTTSGCMLFSKVKLHYNVNIAHSVGIKITPTGPNFNLPPQGFIVDSSGRAGETTRRVQVFRGYPEPPEIFNSVLFSETDIVKP